jgi:hypothetical protein
MNKLSSLALSIVIVLAGVAASVSAEARPYVGVGASCPGYARASYYAHDRYWHHEFRRDRFDRFHHERWDRR